MLVCAVFASLSGLTAANPLPFEEFLYKGQAIPFYGSPSGPLQERISGALKRSQLAERMAQIARAAFRLRQDLGVGFEACGRPNAFFDPGRRVIVICYEMLELMAAQAAADKDMARLGRKDFGQIVDGAVWGIYFHELGHAVISINRIPITGREEDVADQFALYFAINYVERHDVPVVLPTIWFFDRLAKSGDIASSDQDRIKRILAGEHSLNEQRIFNMACWAYGANTPGGAAAANFVGLPPERANRCQEEYGKLVNGIQSRFRKYFIARP